MERGGVEKPKTAPAPTPTIDDATNEVRSSEPRNTISVFASVTGAATSSVINLHTDENPTMITRRVATLMHLAGSKNSNLLFCHFAAKMTFIESGNIVTHGSST